MVLGDGMESNRGVTLSIESNCVTIYIIPNHEGFSKRAKALLHVSRTLPCPGGTCIPTAQFPAIYQGIRISAKKKKGKNKKTCDIKILSILAPGVFNPNLVPRS